MTGVQTCALPIYAAREACTRFRQAATNPGLDTGSDPWTLTQDYCAALETILEAAGRTQVPQFGAMPPVALGDGATWAVRAFYTSAEGRLVRWASVDRTDDAAVARELHSWHVFGDMATTGLPLTLNLVELGTYRAGHRYSWWTRTFAHPAIPRQFKFRSRSGGALQGAWRGVWFRDSGLDPAEWVDLMARDGIRLVHTLEVQPISEAAREEFRRQVLLEAARLAALGSWTSVPMFRAACDWPGTCPWQHKCYAAR